MSRPTVTHTRFVRQPAVIAQTHEHYYVLRSTGIVDVGASSKSALERWARIHGFAPSFVDERPAPLRVEHGL